jgi:hypothetical protein
VFSDSAVTLVSPSVTGIFVDTENPYAAHGAWLQMLVPPHVANDMSESLEELSNAEQVCYALLTAILVSEFIISLKTNSHHKWNSAVQ